MPVQRHFLGWDRPVTHSICDFLIPAQIPDSVDLGGTLTIVPTREAGRRLREALAARCSATGNALLSARVVVPASLFRPAEDAHTRETSGFVTRAIWAEVLHNTPATDFPALFPAHQGQRDFVWAERMGETLQQLRETLADGGHTIQSVFEEHGSDLDEPDRWRDLASAEAAYLSRVGALGYRDATLRKIEQASSPAIPDDITRIVVASVPDPSLLMIRALDALRERLPVEILVVAPEELRDQFDSWGRPIPHMWRDKQIDIPAAESTVILAGTPKSQADQTLQTIADESDRFGPGDVAIGVPDRSVIPYLETTLSEMGLPVFDPADRFVRDHPLYGLLEACVALHTTRSYTALRDCVRHPDILAYLTNEGVSASEFLESLDTFQNKYLPLQIDDITSKIEPPEDGGQRTGLFTGMHLICRLLATFDASDPAESVRDLLQTVYAKRMISSKQPDDQVFAAAAEKVSDVLRECTECHADVAAPNTAAALRLILQRLADQTFHAEREDSRIDLEGWLELPWNDAPFLIATGMNEGRVPDGRLSDMFLPDSLRHRLDLRNDDGRLARDAYVMTLIIETRRTTGKALFIVGKTSSAGDPLKPSRLLFRCPQSELTKRAQTLFAPIEEHEPHHASTVSFTLDPLAPLQGRPPASGVEKLSVTAFRSYLACPFRFYLGNVLNMRALDDSKRELDALDFGSLVHASLEEMGTTDIWQCDDEDAIADFLIAYIEGAVSRRFPRPAPLPVQVSLDAARQRLRQAARVQVSLTRDGWELQKTEARYEVTLNGMRLRGTVDRVDRQRDTGVLRIIDYKTSDSETSPIDAHIAGCRDETPAFAQVEIKGKAKRWIDLQLPLYHLLLQANGIIDAEAELAYFNLPKAVMQTGVSPWKDWTPGLLDSAHNCAEAVVQHIRDGIFWPPASRVDYDDFELLFPAAPESCFLPIPSNTGGISP
jgi:ATP-dependent helicase/nuclease subunit B